MTSSKRIFPVVFYILQVSALKIIKGLSRSFRISVVASIISLVFLGGCSDLKSRLLLQQAAHEGAKGNWEGALFIFQKIWMENPRSRYADLARLSALQIYAGPLSQPDAAAYLARELILEGKEDFLRAEALLRLANILIEERRYQDATVLLEASLPDLKIHGAIRSRLILRLSKLYLQQGRFREAEKLLKEDKPPFGEEGTWAVILGQAYEGMKAYPRAEESFLKAMSLAETGSNLWILASLGIVRIYEEEGRYREALRTLEQLKPHHPNGMLLQAWIHRLEERALGGVAAQP